MPQVGCNQIVRVATGGDPNLDFAQMYGETRERSKRSSAIVTKNGDDVGRPSGRSSKITPCERR